MATLPDSGSGSCGSGLLIFQVTYPFDKKSIANGTHADLVLRSADGVDFRVMKDVLAVASPVFRDMATLAKPLVTGSIKHSSSSTTSADDEYSEDGLPIVVMYESNAIVLDAMLRILYPVVPPKLDSYDILDGLLRAAQKYDMALVLHVVEETLCRLIDENNGQRTMEVYILAWEYQLEKILHLALDAFLRYSFNQSYFSGLDRVPASALFRLFDYRQKVANKVDMLFAPVKSSTELPQPLRCILREIECSTKNIKPAEGCGSNENGYCIAGWWSELRVVSRSEVQKAPLGDKVLNIGLIAESATSWKCCSECRKNVFRQLNELEKNIRREMRKLADEVTFDLPW